MRFPAITAACVLLASTLAPAIAGAAPIELAAHQAVYALTLESSHAGDVAAASGTMAYEVLDACDGWAVRQRLKMTVTNRDGQDVEMVSDYVTWEAKDGLSFTFRMKQTTDTAVTSETVGNATLSKRGAAGVAHYSLPADADKPLPAGTLFPMAHTTTLIAAARDGQKFLSLPLFDGTVASGAEYSSVAVANWMKAEPTGFPLVSDLPSTHVRIAFFDREDNSQQPDYEVGMRYWSNGIADDLHMDFGDFVMRGKITTLTKPPHGC